MGAHREYRFEMTWTTHAADLERLRQSLRRLEGHLTRGGWDRELPDGLSHASIRESTKQLPLPLPVEVVEFYAWHDGFGPDTYRMLPTSHLPTSLAQAVRMSASNRAVVTQAFESGLDEWVPDKMWPTNWLALNVNSLTVPCDVPPGHTAPVLGHDTSEEVYPQTLTESFTDLVDGWVELFDLGAYAYDPVTGRARRDADLMPRKYATNLAF